MLGFTKEHRDKPWLKRSELQQMNCDPSLLDMIKALQPEMGKLQEKLDAILYPTLAADVATVRELMAGSRAGRACTRCKTVPVSRAVRCCRRFIVLHRGCWPSRTTTRPMRPER